MKREQKLQILAELDDLPEELYDQLARTLATTIGGQLSTLREALAERNLGTMRRLTHAIKGQAANMRFYALQEGARVLEEALGGGDWDLVTTKVTLLQEALTALEQDLGESC